MALLSFTFPSVTPSPSSRPLECLEPPAMTVAVSSPPP
jgi:hypothetical protein